MADLRSTLARWGCSPGSVATNTAGAPIPVGTEPIGVAVTP
jgi:hypothetical protein